MATSASRRRSFRRHENLSIPVLPIEGLDEKRAALLRSVHHPAGQSGCVELPSDAKCPQSFGNMQLAVLTTLLTAHALRARLQTSSAMDCNGLLRFKAGARVMLAGSLVFVFIIVVGGLHWCWDSYRCFLCCLCLCLKDILKHCSPLI